MAGRTLVKPFARTVFEVTTRIRRSRPQCVGLTHLQKYTIDLKDNKIGANGEGNREEATRGQAETFADIFKRSKLANTPDPTGQKVEAEVLAVVEGNMYVDFGCKFHAVVPVPKAGAKSFRKGTRVIVRVLDLEMTNHFIGDHRDLSLLEAEAEFVGVA